MNYYGYQRQTPDYGFIERAGMQVSGGIQQLPAAKEAADKRKLLKQQLDELKLDELQAEEIRQQRIVEMMQEYKQTIGDDVDERTATKIEAQFMPPLLGDEKKNPGEAIMRRSDLDSKWKEYLNNEALKKLRSQTGQITTEGSAGPDYQPSGTSQVKVGQQRDLSDIQKDVLNEGLRQPRKEVPRTSEDMYSEGQRMGITETPGFKSDYQRQQDVEAGMLYQPGQTATEFGAGAAASGINIGGGAAKEIMGKAPTENQIATNERLKIQEDQRSKLRMALAKMQDARDRSKNVDKNTLKLLDTQIRAVQAQIDASKSRSDLALGIKTGKDPFLGTTTYSTGKEWEAEYADAESTYESANRLLDYVDQLNRKVNPIPGGAQPKPTGVRKPLSAFER